MTIPALAELRRLYPSAKITLVVRGRIQQSLLEGDELVDSVINMPERARKLDLLRFFLALRTQRFDVAFIGTQISPLLPLLLKFVTGLQRIVGDGDRLGFLYEIQIAVVKGVHRVNRMQDAVAAWSGAAPAEVAFPLARREQDRAAADAILGEHGFVRDDYIIIHPGSSILGGTDKRIPAEVVRRLLGRLEARLPETKIGLIFGPDETDLINYFGPFSKRVVAFSGMQLGVTRSVLSGARIFVGTDSAPGHLAAVEGVKTITVCGPTRPLDTAPWGPQARVIARTEPLTCQPCWGTRNYGNCPFEVRCMKELPETDLLDAVRTGFQNPT